MKRFLLAFVLAFVITAPLLGQDEASTPKTGAAKTKAAAGNYAPQTAVAKPDKALMQAVWDAWDTLDVTNPAKFYAKDGPFPFYDITPLKYSNWQEYETGVQPVLAGFKTLKTTVNDDAVVRSLGKAVLGTATLHMDATTKDGTQSPMDLRWTVVWEKRGPNWLIVHEQISTPMQMEKK